MAERATALTLTNDTIAAEIWKDHVRTRPLGSRPEPDGRIVEVFLDVLVAHATDAHSYPLDDDFPSSFSDDEPRLRDALLSLQNELEQVPAPTAGHAQATALLAALGRRRTAKPHACRGPAQALAGRALSAAPMTVAS